MFREISSAPGGPRRFVVEEAEMKMLIHKLPSGGYMIGDLTDHDFPAMRGALFAATTLDEALKFLRDKLEPGKPDIRDNIGPAAFSPRPPSQWPSGGSLDPSGPGRATTESPRRLSDGQPIGSPPPYPKTAETPQTVDRSGVD